MTSATGDSVDSILSAAWRRAKSMRGIPRATYRVQFHAGFTFRDAAEIVSYLRDLGISHLYASPYLAAAAGSTHGYDVIDPSRLNPELGTEADYQSLLESLRNAGMSHILDVVPNHAGVATNDNPWWNDLLENGKRSKFGLYFDVAWEGSPRAHLKGKVLLPTLGGLYGEVLENGELKLGFNSERGALFVAYHDRRFPIDPATYPLVLRKHLDRLESADRRAVEELIAACDELSSDHERRHEQKEQVKRQLTALASGRPAVRRHVEQAIDTFNGKPGDPASFDSLDALLERQNYRLAYWRTAPDEINYRRFFDINDLAALAMEREEIFQAAHELILHHLAAGRIAGVRIDHPDGLFDPARYFLRLQQHYVLAVAKEASQLPQNQWDALRESLLQRIEQDLANSNGDWPLYVAVEKILAPGEPLPRNWAVHGTSGYDFLNMVNGLFIDPAGEEPMTSLYQNWTGETTNFADLAYEQKRFILSSSLSSELHMLAHELDRLARDDRHARDFTLNGLMAALREVIACFPVYRSYIDESGVSDADRANIELAVESAMRRNPRLDARLFEFVRDTLLLRFGAESETLRAAQRRFAGKFQQVTAPATAKGVEDTAFYLYNRLLSLNEVGGEPAHFGVSPEALHAYLADRQRNWPGALSCLSTHDTKRSEDVRARLNVLSEIPQLWQERVEHWGRINAPHRAEVNGKPAPDRNDEYAIYQTIVGAWPNEMHDAANAGAFAERVKTWARKAVREAKRHSTWTSPSEPYESVVMSFIDAILEPTSDNMFLRDLAPFQRMLAGAGLINSLSQTLLKLAAPGVPDTYQGSELIDLSLVDPDNRRPVEYVSRRESLERMKRLLELPAEQRRSSLRDLLSRGDGSDAKLAVHVAALRCRQAYARLFTDGSYIPLRTRGRHADRLFAFARVLNDQAAIACVVRLSAGLMADQSLPQLAADTQLLLPPEVTKSMRDVFTDRQWEAGKSEIPAGEILADFPVALCLVA